MTGLATLPEASAYAARGGGGGARPTNPSLLAARAFNAATGDDQEMALKLYDYGVENYGDDFVLAYNGLRDERALGSADVTPDKPGTLRRVSETLDTGGPGRTKAGTAAHALPEPPISNLTPGETSAGTAAGAVPDAPYVPANTNAGTSAGAVPNVYHPTPLAGTSAGAVPNVIGPSTTSAGTSEGAVPNTMRPSTMAGTSEGAVPNVYHSTTNAGTSEGAVPNVVGPSVTRAGTSEGAVPNTMRPSTMAGTSAGAVPNVDGGLRSVRGPMTTAAGTYAGQIRLDSPDVATDTPKPPPSGHYGKQPDGSYIDVPPGNEVSLPEDTVTIVKETGRPARMAGDPRNGSVRNVDPPRQMVADPNSGGVASTVVQPPPASGPPTPLTPPTAPPAAAGPPTPTPVADDSGFMSKPDIWSFLTSAGLGAMASGSTSALGAIGAGGTAGVNQLGVLRKDQRERAKNLADAEFQRNRIAVSREAEAGQNTRHGQTIGSNEKIATLQDQGQTNRTGMQIGSNEKIATLQDNGATNRTGMQIGSNEKIATLQDDGATNRTGMTTKSQEGIATMQDQGSTGRTTQTNQTNKEISQGNNDEQLRRQQDAQQHATNQAMLKDRLDRDYLPYRLEQERNGTILGKEDLRDFYIKGGATPDQANEWTAGFHDTDKKSSDLTKDEFVQALDGAAANLGGGDKLTGQQMMQMLSGHPDIAAEIYAELGKTKNSGNGASVVIGILTKHGISYENPYFGSPKLVFKNAPPKAPAPAPAPAPGGGGGARKYDPATGKLVSAQ